MAQTRTLLDRGSMERTLEGLARSILEAHGDGRDSVIVGIQRGGVLLAQHLADRLGRRWGWTVPVGQLDVSMHRDDLNQRAAPPVHPTLIPFDIDGKTVILVDDVLFSGRTIRAAMDALNDFGRPRRIQLAVLIDRGHRELPIRADFVGQEILTRAEDAVRVQFREEGGEEGVYLEVT